MTPRQVLFIAIDDAIRSAKTGMMSDQRLPIITSLFDRLDRPGIRKVLRAYLDEREAAQ